VSGKGPDIGNQVWSTREKAELRTRAKKLIEKKERYKITTIQRGTFPQKVRATKG